MKVYKISAEDMVKLRMYTNDLKKWIDYKDKDLLAQEIEHEVFAGVVVICELTEGMEEIDNKLVINFIREMEKRHEICC